MAQPFLAVLPHANTQSGPGLVNRNPFLWNPLRMTFYRRNLRITLILTALVAQPFLAVLPHANTQSGPGLANRKPFL